MKQEWKDAPEWAQYLAMDDDGEWYWYEEKPEYRYGEWYSFSRVKQYVSYQEDAEKSLEERPK